jgi:Sulfatase
MVHYVIPHVPWRFLPNGSQYVVDGPTMPGLNDQTWGSNPQLIKLAWQRHFEMLRFGDRLLGDAIDQMKKSGLWNKALFIVVADHGGDISPHGSRRPVTKGNFAAVAGVPMFVKLPGQKTGKVDETFTTTMDVVPTIVKQLGIKTDWKFDGTPVDEPHTEKLLRQRNGRTASLVGVAPQRFLAERKSYLARQLQLFPSGAGSIWRAGPRPDLLGRRAATLTRASGAVSGHLDNASLYRRVRPRSGVVPAYVTGTVSGLGTGADVAVAVNGRIRATSKTYNDDGDVRYSVLVPPETLHAGANRVEVYSVRGASARLLATSG